MKKYFCAKFTTESGLKDSELFIEKDDNFRGRTIRKKIEKKIGEKICEIEFYEISKSEYILASNKKINLLTKEEVSEFIKNKEVLYDGKKEGTFKGGSLENLARAVENAAAKIKAGDQTQNAN